MIELQYLYVRFTAIDARVQSEVLDNRDGESLDIRRIILARLCDIAGRVLGVVVFCVEPVAALAYS